MMKPPAVLPLVLMILLPLGTAAAQRRERIVDWALKDGARERALTRDSYGRPAQTDLMALEVISIWVGGNAVAPGRPFFADEDWMKDLRVRVKNISPKPIARVSLSLDVPETLAGDHLMAVSLHFGKRVGPCVDGGEPERAAPGAEFELSMTKADDEHARDWIKNWRGLTSISRLDIRSVSLLFDDCTPWAVSLRPAKAGPADR